MLDAPDWVNVIALTPKKEVILVEQYRFGTERPSLEIPGGVCDRGESPLEAARRELEEETGYTSARWSSLGQVSANPAIQNNYNHFFVAEECSPVGETNFDRHERIIVHKVPFEQFLDLIREGVVDHSLMVAAVAKLLLRKRET